MTNDPTQPPEPYEPTTAPDVRRALARGLQSVAAIIGDNAVVGIFRNETKRIVAKRWPIDAGGLVNAKCQDDMAEFINQLLTEP